MLADVGFGCDKGVRYLVGGPQASIQVLRLLEWPNMQLSATLSGWTTATVAEEFLSPPAAGTLPCGWATGVTHSFTRAFTRATAVPTVKLRLSRLRWEVQAWRTQWPV